MTQRPDASWDEEATKLAYGQAAVPKEPDGEQRCSMCGFMWSLMRQHVRSGEVAQGEKDMEDTSLEEALRD